MTALAATVGIGNIVGVATAITLGGPGAVFWMWLTGLLGMATKYSEALLAVKYREKGPHGMQGGPMYYISKGANLPWLGAVFAFVHLLPPLVPVIWCKPIQRLLFLGMFLIYL
jgi:alanine or glycine:cation symporter, AGCS family